MPRTARDVVFVNGVRTPFGKAGAVGLYAETRADNMVVSVIRELLRRNPAVAAAYAAGQIQPDLVPVAVRSAERGWGLGHRRRTAAPGHHAGGAGRAEDAVGRTAGSPRGTPPG